MVDLGEVKVSAGLGREGSKWEMKDPCKEEEEGEGGEGGKINSLSIFWSQLGKIWDRDASLGLESLAAEATRFQDLEGRKYGGTAANWGL